MSKSAKRQQELEAALTEAQAALTVAHDQLAARSVSIGALTQETAELTSRLNQANEELEQRPPLLDLNVAEGDDPIPVLEAELRSSMDREARLARRIAELEALRVMANVDDDATLPLERARELDERIQSLELQLEAARSREDALAARTVHANAVLADVGQRLAELGEQAERVQGLDADLSRVSSEAEEAKAAEADAAARLGALESEHLVTLERAEEMELRATEAERRFAATEGELLSAQAVLSNLEEVYRAIRDRVADDPAPSRVAVEPETDASPPVPNGGTVPDDTAPGPRYLTSVDLVAAAAREAGAPVAADLAVLDEISALPAATSEDGPIYPGLHVKAAVLLAELAQRRPFERSNERIALAAARTFFEVNGYTVVGGDEELEELGALVSSGQLPLLGIAAALESATARTPSPGVAASG